VNGWKTLPVARSNGNGSFLVTHTFIGDFATWAATPGAVVVSTPTTSPR
jgi:hypothetical protein